VKRHSVFLNIVLDNLKLFCDKWNLKVSIQKTKVMIFNKSGKVLKGYIFSFEEQSLELVLEYKYLGIIFKPSGSFSFAINYLSKKQYIDFPFILTGSHSKLKCSTKSFI
jgi:hypothetical protein